MPRLILIVLCLCLVSFASNVAAQDAGVKSETASDKKSSKAKTLKPVATHSDIQYSDADTSLVLDLFLPKDSKSAAPCVVFVHGGGWKNGSKASGAKHAAWLAEHGFAVASINYRLTSQAQWPAQINDCYAAVRWVRQNASKYNIAPDRIGAFGTSAGGHLVALMGTRACPDSETTSSRVQAVCDWFGPSELLTMPPNNVGDVANSNGAKLLGATVREVPKLAKDASALNQVSSDDAPFLIMHGEKDPGVPLQQSQKLHARLIHAGVDSQLHIVPGAGHGGKEFQTDEVRARVLSFFQRSLMANWSTGSGPAGGFQAAFASAPTHWSVVRGENIRWRKTLPETGQSTVVTWGDKIFFTTMEPVDADSSLGKNIEAWCCDADTGETIWKQTISGDYPLRLSGCFSDSSSPPPVTDGQNVCFFNASGRIACFDLQGKPIWQKELMPVGRTQPLLINGNVVFTKQTYMPDDKGHFSHEHKNAPLEKWTQLQALDMKTGDPAWSTVCGVNMGSIPLPIDLPDGRKVLVVGRGGGHSPPEKPTGISMVSAEDGSTIWTLPLEKFMSTQTCRAFGDHILLFHGGEHLWVNAGTGKIDHRASIVGDLTVQRYDQTKKAWSAKTETLPDAKKGRMIIQQSNLLVGRYHYFRSYTKPWLGRVDALSGNVEYLELPMQLRRTSQNDNDEYFWAQKPPVSKPVVDENGKKKKSKPPQIQFTGFALNECKNNAGHVVMGDNRSRGNGWGHHASQLPTVIGEHLYIPNMSGTVYVIRHTADKLDDQSIVAINDLGIIGQSWNRASLSYAAGRLYAHTIKEIVCIEQSSE